MMIYVTMTLSVLVVELMHVSAKKYTGMNHWFVSRWDNLLISFICGILLCLGFPEIASHESVLEYIDLTAYPSFGGIIIGLCATPIINFIKSQTKDRIEKVRKPKK
jgi:hypothetical protein